MQLRQALELCPVLALVRPLPLAAEEPLMEDQVSAVVAAAAVGHAVAAGACGLSKDKETKVNTKTSHFFKAMQQAAMEKSKYTTAKRDYIKQSMDRIMPKLGGTKVGPPSDTCDGMTDEKQEERDRGQYPEGSTRGQERGSLGVQDPKSKEPFFSRPVASESTSLKSPPKRHPIQSVCHTPRKDSQLKGTYR